MCPQMCLRRNARQHSQSMRAYARVRGEREGTTRCVALALGARGRAHCTRVWARGGVAGRVRAARLLCLAKMWPSHYFTHILPRMRCEGQPPVLSFPHHAPVPLTISSPIAFPEAWQRVMHASNVLPPSRGKREDGQVACSESAVSVAHEVLRPLVQIQLLATRLCEVGIASWKQTRERHGEQALR